MDSAFFSLGIILSLMAVTTGYPEECHKCGQAETKLLKCYEDPTSEGTENCRAKYPDADLDDIVCWTEYGIINPTQGTAKRECRLKSQETTDCNTSRTEGGWHLGKDCCETSLCNDKLYYNEGIMVKYNLAMFIISLVTIVMFH